MAASEKPGRGQRTRGGAALQATGKTQTLVADQVGVSKTTVNHWISGEKRPGPENRDLMRELYGIEPSWWDEHPVRRARSPLPPPSATERPDLADAEAAGGSLQLAARLQRWAGGMLDLLERGATGDDDDLSAGEQAAIGSRLSNTINVLAKLTGQYELGKRMLKLPMWKQLEAELFDALKGHPAAAKEVAERLERFERMWLGGG